uniref:Ras-related protein Rab-6A isoform X1 n=1 Tax=Phascolarctos cinereus TaxID=38626 RepID=A0A6P5KI38_PHACI|nr:ras-related protein Rab-6A isoform X1 [Phascolarctos cinereus]
MGGTVRGRRRRATNSRPEAHLAGTRWGMGGLKGEGIHRLNAPAAVGTVRVWASLFRQPAGLGQAPPTPLCPALPPRHTLHGCPKARHLLFPTPTLRPWLCAHPPPSPFALSLGNFTLVTFYWPARRSVSFSLPCSSLPSSLRPAPSPRPSTPPPFLLAGPTRLFHFGSGKVASLGATIQPGKLGSRRVGRERAPDHQPRPRSRTHASRHAVTLARLGGEARALEQVRLRRWRITGLSGKREQGAAAAPSVPSAHLPRVAGSAEGRRRLPPPLRALPGRLRPHPPPVAAARAPTPHSLVCPSVSTRIFAESPPPHPTSCRSSALRVWGCGEPTGPEEIAGLRRRLRLQLRLHHVCWRGLRKPPEEIQAGVPGGAERWKDIFDHQIHV